jgi:hypothetical protein
MASTTGDEHERREIALVVATWKRRAQQLAGADAARESDDESGQREREPLAQHHAENSRCGRANRHADADLTRPPARGVRHETVQTDDRQHEPH